jgi:hypothetical protein
MDGFFGSETETLQAQRLRQLQLEDRRVATEYRKALHQQFIHHNVFRRIKEQSESSKSGEWNIAQESKYEALGRDITRAMMHDESVCLLKHKHNTPWSPAIGRATSSIRYWDLRIKRGGIRDKNDALLDYYYELSGVGAEFDISLTVRECIRQINNARSKLKDVVNNATELRTQFEVNLAMAVVEHKRPEFRSGETFTECDKDVLVQRELKSRENRSNAKRSWQKLGRQIRGHLKPHTLQKSKLTAVEVSGVADGSWSRIDTKEQVEALLIDRNFEQFSHAGDTPFGYTTLVDELGHTGDTLMADDIYNGTLEHRPLTDHDIQAIVKQLRKHPLLTKMISPVVTTEDFISCFGCVAEKTSSSPSGRHVGHCLACIDLKDELSVLLAAVHAAMMSIPLAEGFFPERWRQAIDIMLEKIPGVPRINKLRIIQLLEAYLHRVLRSAFARNISKLAQETKGIISKHQYGRSHQTCLTPVLNKLLTVQLLIQKKMNGIVFDNDTQGCYPTLSVALP